MAFASLLSIAVCAGLAGAALLASSRNDSPSTDGAKAILQEILSGATCPCGCNSGLPGGGQPPECFGCSVGKSEVSFIREQLAAGRRPRDIVMDLNSPVLIEIFADYTNPKLPETWKRVRGIAAEFGYRRVVVRSTAETRPARHAVQLAECARVGNHFSKIRNALIEHRGPWELDPLLDLASQEGLDRNATRSCFDEIDVASQIEKDRQHARERSIRSFPAVSIDRKIVSDTDRAIRHAIRHAMLEESL